MVSRLRTGCVAQLWLVMSLAIAVAVVICMVVPMRGVIPVHRCACVTDVDAQASAAYALQHHRSAFSLLLANENGDERMALDAMLAVYSRYADGTQDVALVRRANAAANVAELRRLLDDRTLFDEHMAQSHGSAGARMAIRILIIILLSFPLGIWGVMTVVLVRAITRHRIVAARKE